MQGWGGIGALLFDQNRTISNINVPARAQPGKRASGNASLDGFDTFGHGIDGSAWRPLKRAG
jgi:hypothetical protein